MATEEQNNEIDYLSLSDEEIAKLPYPPTTGAGTVDPDPDPDNKDQGGDGEGDQDGEGGESKQDKDPASTGEPDSGKELTGEGALAAGEAPERVSDAQEPGSQGTGDEGKQKPVEGKEETKPPEGGKAGEVKNTDTPVDYEAFYKHMTTPFRANGRDVEIKSAEDAITLMQMGANYNKKMAALKPNLKILKLLEKNQLLDADKLSYLIDLDKKNPGAINKLVKDSGLDPMDLDAEKADGYKPTVRTVDDKEIALDTVLDDLQNSKSYTRTLDIVGNQWDSASRQTIADNPRLLTIISDHVDRGIYDVISKELDRERMLGRLTGMSDLQAYKYVGDVIEARGGFSQLGSSQGNLPNPSGTPTQPKHSDSAALKDKKRAASSSKPVATTPVKTEFDPLAMSDEEFLKFSEKHFR